jgi:hypothetical protein
LAGRGGENVRWEDDEAPPESVFSQGTEGNQFNHIVRVKREPGLNEEGSGDDAAVNVEREDLSNLPPEGETPSESEEDA